METELILQTKVLNKKEMPVSAKLITENLLEKYSGVEAYVIVKNTIETLTQALELMKEKAIDSTKGKEEIILGAEVNLKSTPRKYEYSGTMIKTLTKELEEAKDKLKNHQKILELSDNGWINPATGETEKATLISGEGTQISVTFQGSYKP